MASAPKLSKGEQDFRAEDDFRTMQRAEEIRGDGQRHRRALAHGRKQVQAISRVMRTAMTDGKAPTRTRARRRSKTTRRRR